MDRSPWIRSTSRVGIARSWAYAGAQTAPIRASITNTLHTAAKGASHVNALVRLCLKLAWMNLQSQYPIRPQPFVLRDLQPDAWVPRQPSLPSQADGQVVTCGFRCLGMSSVVAWALDAPHLMTKTRRQGTGAPRDLASRQLTSL